MIEAFKRKTVTGQDVLRLAGLPPSSLDVILLRRGIRPESVAESRRVLEQTAVPFSAEAMLNDTFVAKPQYPTPYPPGRYGSGQWPVYYAALAMETCAHEVAYHLNGLPIEGRYYSVVSCHFRGDIIDLIGEQNAHPDLVSATNAGYPF
ncbi:RES family NAD+ phosphorylase [Bradyrhizobium sp. 180]|nr:RES family NAD+ phosphorylase [Bradyrhizobium sp. 180]